MPNIKNYNRQNAVDYAVKFAFSRNPNYHNFDNLGGDCTNYISQCLYKGSNVQNSTAFPFWYYNNVNDRAPAWTGVEFLYNYLIQNKTLGPFGNLTSLSGIEIGDIINLKFAGNSTFTHSLIVSKINYPIKSYEDILVCAHTIDSLHRPLSNYKFIDIRFIHINGVFV